MKNWKIGTRIAAGFGAVILIAVTLGIFSYLKVGGIEKDSTEVTDRVLPKVYLLGQVQKNVEQMFGLALQHVMTTDTQKMTAIETQIQELRSTNNTAVSEYEKLVNTDKGRDLLHEFQSSRDAFLPALEETLKTSRMGSDGKKHAADMIATRVEPLQEKYSTAAENVVNYNKTAADEASKSVQGSVSSTRTGILLGIAAALGFAIMITIFVTRSITNPLMIALGLVQQIAQGDLTRTVEADSKDELGAMLKSMNEMVENLHKTVSEVSTAANNVANGSEEMSSTAQQLSQGATEQAAAAEESTSSVEEMSSSVQQNADNARQTDKIASKAADDARSSGDAVVRTVSAMKQVAEKISIIEEIARKTDLLALNAAVEAARAGEHGKGFAVVASEVRKLAERSQTAAAEISRLTVDGVETAENAGELLSKLVPDIQKTAELVREIAAASAEQSTGASQVNKAIQQLDQVIQQNSAASEEMASTAEELASQAEILQTTIGFFKTGESHRARPSQKASRGKSRPAETHSATAAIAKMHRALKPSGVSIDLMNAGAPDARDREFAPYEG